MSGFLDTTTDEITLARARAGDREAQAGVYRSYSGLVYTLAYRMVQSPDVADEILQDTFVEVIRKIDTFRGDAPLGAWIRRIAVNKCLMHLRSAWNRYALPLAPNAEDLVPGPSAPGPGRATRAQAQLDIETALAALGPTARAVVWLHDVEGYTHAEIGRLMSRTASFSKSQLARAHRKLRAELDMSDENDPCMQVLSNC